MKAEVRRKTTTVAAHKRRFCANEIKMNEGISFHTFSFVFIFIVWNADGGSVRDEK
jgi:hypothetical protein